MLTGHESSNHGCLRHCCRGQETRMRIAFRRPASQATPEPRCSTSACQTDDPVKGLSRLGCVTPWKTSRADQQKNTSTSLADPAARAFSSITEVCDEFSRHGVGLRAGVHASSSTGSIEAMSCTKAKRLLECSPPVHTHSFSKSSSLALSTTASASPKNSSKVCTNLRLSRKNTREPWPSRRSW